VAPVTSIKSCVDMERPLSLMDYMLQETLGDLKRHKKCYTIFFESSNSSLYL